MRKDTRTEDAFPRLVWFCSPSELEFVRFAVHINGTPHLVLCKYVCISVLFNPNKRTPLPRLRQELEGWSRAAAVGVNDYLSAGVCPDCCRHLFHRSHPRPPALHFLQVLVPLLGLSPREEERLIQIVGPRYREKRQFLRLVSDRFPNRIDNKVCVYVPINFMRKLFVWRGSKDAGWSQLGLPNGSLVTSY